MRVIWIFFKLIALCAFVIIQIGVIGALPYPFSEIPFVPIILSILFLWQGRPSVLWYLIIFTAFVDVYRARTVGVGVISLIVVIAIARSVFERLFSHKSLAGAAMITIFISAFWVISQWFFGNFASMLRGIEWHAAWIAFAGHLFWQSIFSVVVVISATLLAERVFSSRTRVAVTVHRL